MPAIQPLLAAAGRLAQAHLWWSEARCWAGNRCPDTGARCSGQGERPGDVSQSAPRTAMSAWGPAEEVDEGVERHGADWQGIKEPYQLELMPSMDAIRPWGHHAIRMKDAFWPWRWGAREEVTARGRARPVAYRPQGVGMADAELDG